MGHIEKRRGHYRARYRDPLGRQHGKTFSRRKDAERFIRETEVDLERGDWIDPRGAALPLAHWADEFLALARRLSPTTQETYRRDLTKYILPRFGSYRLGRLPADEIENWLNDEVASGIAASSVHRHYRVLRRVLQVAVEKQRITVNPCDRVQAPRVPSREMLFLSWEQAVELLRPTPSGIGRSCTWPSTPACVGANRCLGGSVGTPKGGSAAGIASVRLSPEESPGDRSLGQQRCFQMTPRRKFGRWPFNRTSSKPA